MGAAWNYLELVVTTLAARPVVSLGGLFLALSLITPLIVFEVKNK